MKKKKFDDELIRNAAQFLEDLNNATIEKLYFHVKDKDYHETPDWLQERYDEAMYKLGRWLVKNELL